MIKKQYFQNLHEEIGINNYEIGPSKIHGNGVISKDNFYPGSFINTALIDWQTTEFGAHLNHSDFPNARTRKEGDGLFRTYAIATIKPGDEIVVDYTVNKDLEQPEDGWNEYTPRDDVEEQDTSGSIFGSSIINRASARPDPDKETYLNLLKHTIKVKKVDIG